MFFYQIHSKLFATDGRIHFIHANVGWLQNLNIYSK